MITYTELHAWVTMNGTHPLSRKEGADNDLA